VLSSHRERVDVVGRPVDLLRNGLGRPIKLVRHEDDGGNGVRKLRTMLQNYFFRPSFRSTLISWRVCTWQAFKPCLIFAARQISA
jgi:hypothetical protein